MSFTFGKRSLRNLEGVHPALITVAYRALEISTVDFLVTEGLRSLSKQKLLFASGASQTMNSRHLTGHAIDVAAWVAGGVRWDWPLYSKIAAAMKAASSELSIPIEWGGDWKMRDGPHFQLTWKAYP